MNELIKRLVEQAHKDVRSDEEANGVCFKDYNSAFHTAFAQLIVQECAKKGFDIFDEEPDAPASDLQFYVRDRILQHFGVEL